MLENWLTIAKEELEHDWIFCAYNSSLEGLCFCEEQHNVIANHPETTSAFS